MDYILPPRWCANQASLLRCACSLRASVLRKPLARIPIWRLHIIAIRRKFHRRPLGLGRAWLARLFPFLSSLLAVASGRRLALLGAAVAHGVLRLGNLHSRQDSPLVKKKRIRSIPNGEALTGAKAAAGCEIAHGGCNGCSRSKPAGRGSRRGSRERRPIRPALTTERPPSERARRSD